MKRTLYKIPQTWYTSSVIGKLTPFQMMEVTPNDVIDGNITGIFRLAPMDAPAFLNLKIYCYLFYIPHRYTWPAITGQITETDVPSFPTVAFGSVAGEVKKAFGMYPNSVTSAFNVNLLPIYAYNSIYNHMFRDELTSEVALSYASSLHTCHFPGNTYLSSIRESFQQQDEASIDTSQPTVGVREIRKALADQRRRERRVLYGEDYTDMLRTDYGVTDLEPEIEERPHLIAKGRCTMGVSEVVATATSASEETGEIRGRGGR